MQGGIFTPQVYHKTIFYTQIFLQFFCIFSIFYEQRPSRKIFPENARAESIFLEDVPRNIEKIRFFHLTNLIPADIVCATTE